MLYNEIAQAVSIFVDLFPFIPERTPTMLTFKDNKGQGLVEYALILVLVAVVVIVILALLGPAIANVFSGIMNAI
jgi:pilus assembly protein Flp/PilA